MNENVARHRKLATNGREKSLNEGPNIRRMQCPFSPWQRLLDHYHQAHATKDIAGSERMKASRLQRLAVPDL
jgi:hypothetical protein